MGRCAALRCMTTLALRCHPCLDGNMTRAYFLILRLCLSETLIINPSTSKAWHCRFHELGQEHSPLRRHASILVSEPSFDIIPRESSLGKFFPSPRSYRQKRYDRTTCCISPRTLFTNSKAHLSELFWSPIGRPHLHSLRSVSRDRVPYAYQSSSSEQKKSGDESTLP